MEYEIKMIIGRATDARPEIERDLSLKFSDGSGHPSKKDEEGQLVKTGRAERYFMVYAELDLCKLGYQDDALNRLIKKSHEDAKRFWSKEFCYFYGTDGNTEITEDCYGEHFWPVPIEDVLAAINESIDPKEPYRRLTWAKALLEVMANDSEKLTVLFWGH